MLKKSFLAVTLCIICIVCMLTFAGCDNVENNDNVQESSAYDNIGDHMERVSYGKFNGVTIGYYRDVHTDVMYVSIMETAGTAGGMGLSVMYAEDGTPLLYSEWLALQGK